MKKIYQKEKQKLFKTFLNEWGEKFAQIQHILHYLHTYDNVTKKLELNELLNPDEIENSQMEWVWLYSKFDGLEKEFFKPYWVPIQSDCYNYFIDLSTKTFSVFSYHYFFFEPYQYFNLTLFKKISDLMLAEYLNLDLKRKKRIELQNLFRKADGVFAKQKVILGKTKKN